MKNIKDVPIVKTVQKVPDVTTKDLYNTLHSLQEEIKIIAQQGGLATPRGTLLMMDNQKMMAITRISERVDALEEVVNTFISYTKQYLSNNV